MLISDIIPYDRNARHNERAIPKVAESIREFGLRGTIGLESRESPVIVFGHTRVAACETDAGRASHGRKRGKQHSTRSALD